MATAVAPPPSTQETAKHAQTAAPVVRQCVRFTMLKVMPEWRRLPAEERAEHKRLFVETLQKWNQPGKMLSITYSTVGLRPDADMVIWTICYGMDELNSMMAELLRTPLGGYLITANNYIAMTKRSQYMIDHGSEDVVAESRTHIRPGGQKYIFIYPFWKTRAWYLLPMEERQRLMAEHIRIGMKYPRVKLNTTYSFGLDDQEFVVAFESNYPEDFLDLVQQLRETEISMYTLKDTPIYSCVRVTPQDMLDRLG